MTQLPDHTGAARIPSIDIVRGAVMIFMALDHVRDFVSENRFPPENLALGSTPLFLTRWITHFCAPTFFLLAGVGIGIAMNRGRPRGQLGRYLVARGVWLIILDLVITPIGWQFGFDLIPAFAMVLWALGWSMLVMAVLVHLPRAAIATVAVAMILGHNLLDGVQAASFGELAGLWHLLHQPGFVVPGIVFGLYPLVPWIGVMALGTALAGSYTWEAGRRRRMLIALGASATVAFVLLRALNGYGDPGQWSPQRTAGLTLSSFLNVLKYPPSLLFLLMTLGPALVALALTERARGRLAGWISVYGRVPLFFYVIHIFVAHAAAVLLGLVQLGELRRFPVITDLQSFPPEYGLPLPGVYLVWALVVILLYYPCRRFARLKSTRDDWWLRYL